MTDSTAPVMLLFSNDATSKKTSRTFNARMKQKTFCSVQDTSAHERISIIRSKYAATDSTASSLCPSTF